MKHVTCFTQINKGSLSLLSLLLILVLALAVPCQATNAPPARNDLLQFTAGGHVLGFRPDGIYVAGVDHALHIEFIGASGVAPIADQDVSVDGKTLPLGRTTYPDLWPGISLTYEQVASGIVESTWRLAPGAEAEQIRLHYNVPLQVDAGGNLVLTFATGQMRESAPVAWQEIDGQRVPVEVAFHLLSEQEMGFTLGFYDPAYPLMIDPTLQWNTFLGSPGAEGSDITVDGNGNIYVIGSSDTTWGTPINPYAGGRDVFVAKLNSNGVLQWNTFLGSSSEDYGDYGEGIAVDSSGNVYVTGGSGATWGTPINPYLGGINPFVAKLNSNGALQWNTFLVSSTIVNEYGKDIAVDDSGYIYVTGNSLNYAAAFVAKLTGSGTLQGLTLLEPATIASGEGITVDSSSNIYIVGSTGGHAYASVVKLSSGGTLLWETLLGSVEGDGTLGYNIALDSSGNVYVTGESDASWGIPINPHSGEGDWDTFAAKLNSSGDLQWHTFLESGGLHGWGGKSDIVVDSSDNIYVTGAVQEESLRSDIFIAELTDSGDLEWYTLLGSSGASSPWSTERGIAVDNSGMIYVTAESTHTWGTPVNPHSSDGSAVNAFVAAIDPSDIAEAKPLLGETIVFTDMELHGSEVQKGVVDFDGNNTATIELDFWDGVGGEEDKPRGSFSLGPDDGGNPLLDSWDHGGLPFDQIKDIRVQVTFDFSYEIFNPGYGSIHVNIQLGHDEIFTDYNNSPDHVPTTHSGAHQIVSGETTLGDLFVAGRIHAVNGATDNTEQFWGTLTLHSVTVEFLDTLPYGILSGTVRREDNNEPIEGLNVFATDYATNQWMAGTWTDSDGSYILFLPSGSYRVRACASCDNLPYVDEYYDDTLDYGAATPVELTDLSPDASGIDFLLEEGGTISGTVEREDDNEPIEGLHVFATDYTTNQWIAGTNTDSEGNYSLRVPEGSYRVRACASCDSLPYVDEYYDDTLDYGAATPVELTDLSPDASDIDFLLEEGGVISGTVYESSSMAPLTGVELEVRAMTGDPCDFSTWNWGPEAETNPADGTYTITGVPSGTYYLRIFNEDENYIEEWWAASASTGDCNAAEQVTVNSGETITGRDFQLEPGATISGTVYEMDGTTPVTGGEEIIVIVGAGDPCGQQFIVGRLIDDTDGTYTILGVPAGNYFLRTWNELGYIDEWWDGSTSTPECQQAAAVPVTVVDNISGIDFSLGIHSESVPSGGETVSLPDDSASVVFPPGAVPDEVFVSIAQVDEASVPPPSGGFELLGSVYDFSAEDTAGNPVTSFGKMLTITLRYDPADLGGLDELSLTINYYDEGLASWVPILPSFVDTVNHTVTAETDHFSLYALFGIPIPEPTTWILFGFGLLGLLALARRKRRQKK
jgi:hypothetical protein